MLLGTLYLRDQQSILQVLNDEWNCLPLCARDCYTVYYMKRNVSKRRQTLVRAGVYSAMTLIVIVIVTLLTFVVMGYQFNERDGRIEQGGLLQFGSIPTGATVELDGTPQSQRTNSKANVAVGSHNVEFTKSNYRTWQKTIYIKAGQVGWLSYARLVPTTIKPTSLRVFGAMTSALGSPQNHYLVLHESADQPLFTVVDMGGDTPNYDTLSLPADSYTQPSVGKTQTFTPVSWSDNEAAILIRHTYDDDKTEWLVLERDAPQNSVNITSMFTINPTNVQFAGKGDRSLFVLVDGSVRRINVDGQTISRPLATNVDNFTVYDDQTIAYATLPDEQQHRSVGYAAVDIDAPVTVATYPADGQPLLFAMSTYYNQRYVATVHGQNLLVQTGSLPTKNNKGTLTKIAAKTIGMGAAGIDMFHNSRFVVVTLASGYGTYDIELDKYDETTWTYKPTTSQIHWLDDFMLWSDGGGELRFYDFDGANQQNIMPVTEGFTASISANDKYIYGILKTERGYELRRAQLVL